MDLIGAIAHHGYVMTAIILLLASLGAPLPVAIALLAAGAASHKDLSPGLTIVIAWIASLLGDMLLFLGGKYTGWWLPAGICRIPINPEQCIFSSADAFYRRGPWVLLIAKFIPGLGTVAAPLAGSLHMRWQRFLGLMAAGEAFYCAAWFAIGYIFYRFIDLVINWITGASHAVLLTLLLAAAGYGLAMIFLTVRARRYRQVEKISAAGLRQHLDSPDPNRVVVIADVRSHNYYDPGMQRIKNSIRVEPNRLQEELTALKEFMAPECEIYIYCSCIRDTTSVRVAHALRLADLSTKVIEGGMKAWIRAGGEVEVVPETDVQHLPQFD